MPGKSGQVHATDRIIGDRVAQLRMRHGWTQRTFSERLKTYGVTMHRNSINDLEHGKRKIKVGELLVLAMVLQVSPLELLAPSNPTDLISISETIKPELAIKVRLWMLGHGALVPEPVKGGRRAPNREAERLAAEEFYSEHGHPELDGRRFVRSVQQLTRELTESDIVDDHEAMNSALDQLEKLIAIGRREIAHERVMSDNYAELEAARERSTHPDRVRPSLEEEAMRIVESWVGDDVES